jgi:hypothetical protein
MPIKSVSQTLTGTVQVNPQTGEVSPQVTYITTTDDLATFTTPNYIYYLKAQGFTFGPQDIVWVTCPAPDVTPLQWMTLLCNLDLNDNQITLVPDSTNGNVIGPVTPSHIAVFATMEGAVSDGGVLGNAAHKNVSDNTKPALVSINGSTAIGDLAAFSDVNGTLINSGVTPSDNTKARVASVFSSTAVGNIPIFSDILGTISDSGTAPSSTTSHVSAVSGSVVIGHLPVFSDVLGTIIDSGISPSATTFVWSGIAGTSHALAAANGNWTENAGLTTFTLPTTIAAGDVCAVVGSSAGGWTITQGTGQQIRNGTSLTTLGSGGSLSSTARGDCVYLLCTTANTIFIVINSSGNLTPV